MLQEFILIEIGISMHLEFFRDRKGGQQDIFFQVQYLDLINHCIGIVERFGNIAEQLLHFLRCFKIKLVIRKFKPAVLEL